MNKKRVFLILSLIVTIIAAGAIEFYILLEEGFGQGIIERFFIQNNKPKVYADLIDMEARYPKFSPNFIKNEINRKLGLFKRWTETGEEYYVFTDSQLKELRKMLRSR